MLKAGIDFIIPSLIFICIKMANSIKKQRTKAKNLYGICSIHILENINTADEILATPTK